MSDSELLQHAIDSAKNFQNFSDVHMAVHLHPEWLTLIPANRQWAIIHQITLAGIVGNLDKLLALQKSNKNFRLLTPTRDNKTVKDIASIRTDTLEMKEHIEKLIKLDEMLNYAKAEQWDQCYDIIKEHPTYVNEKPSYRLYYLIHHMASTNAFNQFERFRKIKDCVFDVTLCADRKKVNVIAREAKSSDFAAAIEKLYPSLLEEDDASTEAVYKASEESLKQTKNITLLIQNNVVKDLDDNLLNKEPKYKSRAEVAQEIAEKHAQGGHISRQTSNTATASTAAEEEARKARVLESLTCPLTLAIFIDPVVAADGFTYERSAIRKWIEKNDRSPMTNQKFAHKELNPNNVIKQILAALQPKP